MTQPKCIRIEMEYDDGGVYRTESPEAAELVETHMKRTEILSWIHQMNYSGPPLKRVEKP